MQKNERNSIYVNNTYSIITPEQLKTQFPITHLEQKTIADSQNIIMNIIHRRDPRLLVICGPCSIHDVNATFDYADKLKILSTELQDQLYIVMRVYLEKPRTSIGWKGLINDPHMNGSNDIELGLKTARNMLVKLTKIGLPLATEVLNPYIPQYIGELFSWSSIGARTTESQIHREIASGLYTPVGFKNSTSGNFSNAVNAIHAAMMPHRYISINQSGQVCLLHTKGNLNAHIILRGGENPNYYPEDIIDCEKQITEAGLPLALMVDCSHGNSNKDYRRQIDVAQSISHQIKYGNRSIIGLMIESYIYPGNQSINLSSSTTQYGVSVTDACIDWKTTKHLLYDLHKELKPFLINRI
ncbi:3-deoxy-7-phosphoheptulonate synthase [Candidatus Blochmanniella camponoti]|uniref:Phospho-2-dehydro-3-deoxyheptonate aldolase n=1 Tax=Candidatus Blochmanniella camponoti TaxID=108080 RepID=A0AAE9L6H5_9ENTR|nr:3-deoxy-7-phosphoheptulonate synthase [Candidatus Blochmannia herculeanus]URJ24611.1 3-deoxy-7-phosphoheptulonate synthase [Candidatus Blochmannia herculeanus]URJ26782.1 3-deoxy-7-phosphoheptulonate synthase [Candidatus Blochmannia herculeanus]URJ27415.1 3-deoxy-7-phosphoheptulonate synthase [Candidatus Blochmannia herculeanus]